MAVTFEVLAPSSERGSRMDFDLQRARATTTFGRARILHASLQGTRPGVMREVDAPRGRDLDDRLAALGESLVAVTDPTFVRVLRVARSVSTGAVGMVTEYVEGAAGAAPEDPARRVRAVAAAGVALFGSLARLHTDRGLAHGAVKPAAVLLGARGPEGLPLPLRLFDLGVGAMGSAITAARSEALTAASLERSFEPAAHVAALAGSTLCTAVTWGTPGYVPLGHFAASEPPTLGTDLYGALATLWELLVGAPFVPFERPASDLPWGVRALRLALAADSALAATLADRVRRDRLRAALFAALPGANSGALAAWVDFFDGALDRGARTPAALGADALRADWAGLPDPYATARTVPLADPTAVDEAALPSVVALEPGVEYRAEVVLDYFSGDDGSGRSRALRFRHVAMLGEGAMGSVHRVELLRAGEAPLPAALKLAVDDSVHNRDALLREAHVLRAQRHDGMTQFLALVELPGRSLALIMSYQPGTPLDAILAARRLTTAEALALGRRLLGTLVALHADASPNDPTEVVHGDIKPGNVIVPLDANDRPEFGAAVLIDFGVSRLRLRLASPPTTTTEGMGQVLGGTVGYMPVGHLQGGASPASDVFAVAAVLYEGLTGRMPWAVEGADRFSPLGLAFATERLMRERPHTPLSLREVPPWRRHRGWSGFFRRTLSRADPMTIPSAREALGALDAIRRDLTFPAAVAAALVAVGALGGWWFDTAYCPRGQVRCDGACAALADDERHCGACGVACAAGQQCRAGACVASCSAGLVACAGICRDLATDTHHCGACGRACGSGQVCASGHCATSCEPGFTLCSGSCRDLATDRAHCGACGRPCASGQACARGVCAATCAAGFTDCAGSCRDLRTDRAHCGACGTVCGAGENCLEGACRQECPPGLSLCAGRCRDPAVDVSHCGACGVSCAGGTRCEGGRCVLSCAEGLSVCGEACRDLRGDLANCGACGRACGPGERCAGGACEPSCARGFTACDGACRELARDEDHCGACERRCDRGQTCDEGRCVTFCGAGLTLCDGRCRDPAVDESHCGACGRACERGELCVGGQCRAVPRPSVPSAPPSEGAPVVEPADAPPGGRLPSTIDLSGGPVGTPGAR